MTTRAARIESAARAVVPVDGEELSLHELCERLDALRSALAQDDEPTGEGERCPACDGSGIKGHLIGRNAFGETVYDGTVPCDKCSGTGRGK
jgi:hypothetical protein